MKLSIFQKDNVPSTVDVLRGGEENKQLTKLNNDLVNIQASNSVYVGGSLCWLKKNS